MTNMTKKAQLRGFYMNKIFKMQLKRRSPTRRIESSCDGIWLQSHVDHNVKDGPIIGRPGEACMYRWVLSGAPGVRGERGMRRGGRPPRSSK